MRNQRPRTSSHAAAEGLAEALVGEQHFLLDEGPADQLPEREGEADHGDRQQQHAERRQQLRADHPPEALAHPAQRRRGRSTSRSRSASRATTIAIAATSAWATGRMNCSSRSAQARLTPEPPGLRRFGDQPGEQRWSPRSAPAPPAPRVRAPSSGGRRTGARRAGSARSARRRRSVSMSTGRQLVTPTKRTISSSEDDHRRRRGERRFGVEVDEFRGGGDGAAERLRHLRPGDRAAGQARAGGPLLSPSRRTVRATGAWSADRSGRC